MIDWADAAQYILCFSLTFMLVGNILVVLVFRLVRFIEWLSFALKVTNDSHNKLKRSKQSNDVENNAQPSASKGVEDTGWVFKINNYVRSTRDSQYEEQIKQSLPRFLKVLDWLISITHNSIISKVKSMKQPNANSTLIYIH